MTREEQKIRVKVDKIKGLSSVMYSIRNGRVISQTKPKEVGVFLGEERVVDFK